MKTETNVKPLYVRLNEQITPDQWVIRFSTRQIGTYEICTAESDPTTIALLPSNKEDGFNGHATEDETFANARYTALAVNNLHHLADALNDLIMEFGCYDLQKETPPLIERAKEALKRIS